MFKNILIFCLLFAGAILGSNVSFAESLGDVDIQFCNNLSGQIQSGSIVSGSTLYYKTAINQPGKICYTINNLSDQSVVVKVSFVDGTFTNDERQNKACLSDANIQYFGKYVTGYDILLPLSGKQSYQKEANFTYPAGTDGIYHGCLVYSVLDPNVKGSGEVSNFTILMRKAKFIDVLVGDHLAAAAHAISLLGFNPTSGDNLSKNPAIRVYVDPSDGKYVLQLQVQNTSSMDQKVSLTGSISNVVAYRNVFSEPRKILRGETLLITKKLDQVPRYNMRIKIKASFTPEYDPMFGNEKFTEGGSFIESTNIWIFNTTSVLSLIAVLLIGGIFVLLITLLKRQRIQSKSIKSRK